ncbi:tRNA lysidine(34) synthetase TilS [Hoylesella pleuritidis]|jgi:tRNA(ile)-lysidine synthetase|uniref:tRNA(Ile)-lysidine synthase n=1 Tax=Hoylesella pleuritidis F0068 TaxID=1081904 RepID=U2L6U6_9BACT|nr:tRNA lysidine(34) synthetase TilS [Hoylesella pleuritidis]ERK00051.1 tRNA(Ile)-lysidine synthetase [Hoylesella pleuritidis F0068]
MKGKFLKTISDYISHYKLLKVNGKYLVALSGGADSVALLRVLLTLGYAVEAIHCNFHLRGEESDRDEFFCKTLCNKLGVTFHSVHFDTITYARQHKVSIEMAARELRYRYFERLCQDIDATAICVAHHRDDNAETVLLNLIRGTGITGLAGIAPRRGYIIRPLLGVNRQEIIEYLDSIKQDFVTDSTNLTDNVVRNKIRLHILPLLADINPSVSESIAKTADHVREATKYVESGVKAAVNQICKPTDRGCYISLDELKKTISVKYTLYEILKTYGFNSSQIKQIAESLNVETGKEWHSKTHTTLIDRGHLLIELIDDKDILPLKIYEDGTYIYGREMTFYFLSKQINGNNEVFKKPNCVCLDARNIHYPLIIRKIKAGDRFVPFGMTGSKLVSDYLTDCKMPLFKKRRQLVVTNDEGKILWLVNQRPSNEFCITPSSKKQLIIRFMEVGKG